MEIQGMYVFLTFFSPYSSFFNGGLNELLFRLARTPDPPCQHPRPRRLCSQSSLSAAPIPRCPPAPVLTGGRGAPLAPFPHALLHVTKSQTLLPDSPAKLRPLRIGQNPGLWSFILCVELAGPVYSGICSDITLDDSVKVVLFRSG